MNEDDRLIKALNHANYKATISQQRENLKLKFANDLIYGHNGGIFTISDRLITFVDFLIREGHADGVLIDDKNIPVQVDDLQVFRDEITELWFEASNEYLSDWNRLRKARSVQAAIEI